MISKELLSEAMRKQIGGDEECKDIKIINNVLYFTAFHKHKINIYELARLCKEWAFDKEIAIKVDIISKRDWYIEMEDMSTGDKCFSQDYYNHTESEAIFKACEWILREKR